MTGEPTVTPDIEENASFADLLEAHGAGSDAVRQGERINAAVIAITEDTVFVDTGSKVDGVVERKELEQPDGTLPAIGDKVELYVISVTPQEIRLSRTMGAHGGATALIEARDAAVPVEGKVTGTCKGGYNVEVMNRRAFCPGSQIDLHPLADAESVVGQTFPFLVTKVEKGGRNIVVSRRMLLDRERQESLSAFLETIKEGDVIEGTVARLTAFGAFLTIAPGVEGLVHVSELSWARVQQPDEAVTVGDTLRVKVLSIAQDPKGRGMRISLSAKQAMGDPWSDVAERLVAGQVVEGKVIRLAPFGAFVEVLPGIEGLVHVSEMSWTRRINKPEDAVAAGDVISVKVKEFDAARRRLSLSMRDAEGDPWADAAERFPVGSTVNGTIEKRAQFGLFVNIAPGITGLLPAGLANSSPASAAIAKMNAGDTIELLVRELDTTARKITLAPEGAGSSRSGEGAPQREDKNWKQYAPKADKPAMGLLGAALQAAMKQRS